MSGGLWRGPVLAVEELRAERPLVRWDEVPWIREPLDSGPDMLRVTGERKCQSLGTEEWRPAVGLGRQLSDGEAEYWSQEQQHRLRPSDGSVSATVRAKSPSRSLESFPRRSPLWRTSSNGAQNHPPTQRSSSSAPYGRYHSEWPAGERVEWSGPKSCTFCSMYQSQGFSRPHQAPHLMRLTSKQGSLETLSSETVSKPRDRSVCFSQSIEPLRGPVWLLFSECRASKRSVHLLFTECRTN